MPLFTIHHVTKYTYNRAVKESINEIKIYPYQCSEQEVLQHEVFITGNPDVYLYTDYWGNKVGSFSLANPHKDFIIESKLVIRTTQPDNLEINFTDRLDDLQKEIAHGLSLIELSKPELIEQQATIEAIIQQLPLQDVSVATNVQTCSQYIYNNFTYKKGITTTETTVDEILNVKAGVCQDFAHLLLQILRSQHIPCRYVSGYICPNKNGMRGEGATHAWVEAYLPKIGWIGIDPTNNIWVGNTHVKLAVGKNFKDCTPTKGTFKGPAKQQLSVYVSIGYEDGAMFEDINDVTMQQEASTKVALQELLEEEQQQQ